MARIGMRYPIYVPYTVATDETGSETETLGTMKSMGKAIRADASINTSEATLYADDGLAETVQEFVDGTLTIETDDLEDEVQAELLGNKVDADSGDIENTTDDTPTYCRTGYISRRYKNGVSQYKGILYMRVKYNIPNQTDNTKGQTITFSTPSMVGTIGRDAYGKWRRMSKWFKTADEAKSWLTAAAVATGA